MRKILILFFENRNIETYPYVLNLIKLMPEEYKIDFLVTPEMYSEHCFENLTLYKTTRLCYTKSAVRHLQKHGKEYSIIIAYSIEGIWAACYYNILHFWKKIPFVYFSMELFETDKICPRKVSRLLKIFNGLDTKMLKFSVAQDAARAKILKKRLDFVDRVFLLPNSCIGYSYEKSNFAYEKFSIPYNKKILLYAGALERWGFDINLAKYINKLLKEDYVLLLSGFSRDNYIDKILSEYFVFIEERKIIINTEILADHDHTEMVKSAHIGLAWYTKLDSDSYTEAAIENIYYMGWSSGKLCKYLSCSIPVIAPSFYFGYQELIEDKKIGKVSDYSEEMADRILMISSNYDVYKKNVENVYKNELEYSTQCQEIIRELESIMEMDTI